MNFGLSLSKTFEVSGHVSEMETRNMYSSVWAVEPSKPTQNLTNHTETRDVLFIYFSFNSTKNGPWLFVEALTSREWQYLIVLGIIHLDVT